MSSLIEKQSNQTEASNEDLTGQDRLVSNVVYSWAAHFVFIIAGFIMPRMIDRRLGQELLGVWDFGWSLVSYFALVQVGVQQSVNRYVAKFRAAGNMSGVNCVVSSAFCIQNVAGSLVLGLTIGLWLLLPRLFGPKLGENVGDTQWVVLFLGASIGVEMALNSFNGVLTGCHRWDLHNFIKSGWHIATVAGMITALLWGGGVSSLATITLTGIVLECVTRAIVAYRVCRGLRLRLSYVKLGTIRELFVFGGKTVITALSNLLLNQTTSILIVAYLGPAALALYARPRSLVYHINALMHKMAMTLTPTTSSLQSTNNLKEIRLLLIKSVRYSIYLVLPMILTLVVFGGVILEFWMGPDYANSLIPAVLAIGYLAALAQTPIMMILVGLNAHGRAGIANFVAALCSAGLVFLALGPFGLGLAGATIAVTLPLMILNIAYLPVLICRRVQLDLGQYFLSVTVGPAVHVLPFAICLIIARLVFTDEPTVGLIWGGAVGGAILGVLYWMYLIPVRIKNKFAPLRQTSIKGYLRSCIATCMWWTGIIRLFQYVHRNEIVIWTIHGVMDDQDNPSWKPLRPQLSRKKLDEYLQVLSKRYHFISLSEAVEILQGRKPIQPYSMVFTFDDGYRNNLTHAMPILRRNNAPATFFICTGYAGNPRPFWFDRLDYAMQHAEVEGMEAKVGDIMVRLDGSSRIALQKSYQILRREAKEQQMSDLFFLWDMDQLAGRLETESDRALSDLQNEDDWSAVLTWDQIEKNRNGDITIGSHTVDHIRLDLVEERIGLDQLRRSKRDIELHTGKPCQAICYPSGNFTEAVANLSRECDYTCGLTSNSGLNSIGDDVMALKRIHMPIRGGKAELLFQITVACMKMCRRHWQARQAAKLNEQGCETGVVCDE